MRKMVHMSQVYGYARVSTDNQDAERQVSEILTCCEARGLGHPVIVRETASGAKARPLLDELLGSLGHGDTVLVWELSRLTRGGVAALFAIVKTVHDAGAVLVETKSGTTIDTSVQGEAYVFALGLSARIERDMISERTRSALRIRRERGVKLGRPRGPGKSRLDPRREWIVERLGYGVPVARLAEDCGVTEATLHRYLNTRGLRKPATA
jgi:DNA invertase Pin-like site-specific DNA recombinase